MIPTVISPRRFSPSSLPAAGVYLRTKKTWSGVVSSAEVLLAEADEHESVPPRPECAHARRATFQRRRWALRGHDDSCVARRSNAEKRHLRAGHADHASLAEAVVPAKACIKPLDGEDMARPATHATRPGDNHLLYEDRSCKSWQGLASHR